MAGWIRSGGSNVWHLALADGSTSCGQACWHSVRGDDQDVPKDDRCELCWTSVGHTTESIPDPTEEPQPAPNADWRKAGTEVPIPILTHLAGLERWLQLQQGRLNAAVTEIARLEAELAEAQTDLKRVGETERSISDRAVRLQEEAEQELEALREAVRKVRTFAPHPEWMRGFVDPDDGGYKLRTMGVQLRGLFALVPDSEEA